MKPIFCAMAALALAGCGGSTPVTYELPATTAGRGTGEIQEAPIPEVTTERRIREEVREELGDEGLDADAIAVLVDGNSVTLVGEVRSIGEVERARRVAADVEGVERVDVNRLAVQHVVPDRRMR